MKNTLPALPKVESQKVVSKKIREKEVSVSIKPVLRSQKGPTKGIYLRVIIDRKFHYFSTGYFVLPDRFDEKYGTVKRSTPNRDVINNSIVELNKDINDVIYDIKKSGNAISIDELKSCYNKRFSRNTSFEDFFKSAMEEKEGTVEDSTLEVYRRLLNRLNEFQLGVTLQQINRKFIKAFEKFLLKGEVRGQNTTNHYLETLRTFMIMAVDDQLIDINPFNKIKIPKLIGERDYLAEEELLIIKNLKIPRKNTGERRVRELFVFCCLTGIRYSDLVRLKWENVRKITNELHFKMHKTDIWVTIPLQEEALQIINKQAKDEGCIFSMITNQKMNEHLHTIEKRAKIQKNVTVHVARHTFATLCLERGIPIDVVSKYLGHKSIRMTMIYAHITSKRLHQEMQKMNGLAVNPNKSNAPSANGSMQDVIAQMKATIGLLEGQLKNSGVTNLRAV